MDSAQELHALPRAGDTIDRYRVVARIGMGGMAAVYAVRRSSIGGFEKLLAMKVMLPHLAVNERFVAMFLDEARIASRIGHRNVVEVIDVGTYREMPFLVMELLSGRNFAQVLAALASMPEGANALRVPLALAVLAGAAEGLHAAHETVADDGKLLEVVHRDVSPQNIFVTTGGDVKVVDFGVAAARGRMSETHTGELKGKLRYLAPEQVTRAHDVTRASDIWSLGVVAWEALSGRRLFEDQHEASALWDIVESPIDDIAALCPGLPAPCAEIVRRSLERNPAKRPANALVVARAFAEGARVANGSDVDLESALVALFGDELRRERTALADATRDAESVDRSASEPASVDSAAPRPAGTAFTSVTETDSRVPGRSPRWKRTTLVVAAAALAMSIGASSVAFRAPGAKEPQLAASAPVEPPPAPAATSEPDSVAPQAAERRAAATAPAAPSSAVATSSSAPRPRAGATRAKPRPVSSSKAPISNPLFKNPF